ncbi:hypothetical protein QL287_02555, partial [Mycoplasma sp. M6620]
EKELHSSRGALRQDYKFLYQINILHIQIICHSVGIKTAEIPTAWQTDFFKFLFLLLSEAPLRLLKIFSTMYKNLCALCV